jgi:tetratricopeptide (TPR) repeat protein
MVSICYGGVVSFNICGKSVVLHTAVVIFVCGCLFYSYGILKKIMGRIFHWKPGYEKGLNNLQLAFSATLLRDKSEMEKALKKAEKYLGNIPLIAWLKGQQSLMSEDKHRAKAIFYSLCEREKNTILGAYSLSQLAINEKSDNDALVAINAVLKIFPNSQDLIQQGIAIAVKNKNFAEAKKHLQKLKISNKSLLIEAIVHAEEGILTRNTDLLQRAFRLAPELSGYTINYAELLIKNCDYKGAQNVLKKSFKAFPHQEVFNKCISICDYLQNDNKIELANQLIEEAPESWIGYLGLARILQKDEMTFPAFRNFLLAYEKGHFDFIGRELVKAAENLSDPKPAEALRIISQPLEMKHINMVWKCTNCGTEEARWVPVCSCCTSIAEYRQILMETQLLLV